MQEGKFPIMHHSSFVSKLISILKHPLLAGPNIQYELFLKLKKVIGQRSKNYLNIWEISLLSVFTIGKYQQLKR